MEETIKKLMDMVKHAARMAKNQKNMEKVWQDIERGPDFSDPGRYIAALACLNQLTDAQLNALSGCNQKTGEIVDYARRCAAGAAIMAEEREGA